MAQGWKKAFERLFWKNRPSTDTPLNATDMNHIESGIDALDDRIVQLDVLKADAQVVNGMVSDVSLNESDGVITVTYKNGSTETYDTNLEKIATNFTYDYSTQRLVLTLSDGSKQYVDMSALITQYEFKDSTTIAFSVDSTGKVSASVKNGSITDAMLETGYLANITAQATKAESMANSATTSSNSAYDNAKLSQSYAIGGSGVRDGENTDNAKYYYEQAKKTDIGQIRSEVDELNSNLSELEFGEIAGGKNLFNPKCLHNATYDEKTDTIAVSSNTNKALDMVFKENTQYTFSAYIKQSDSTTNNRFRVIYTDGTSENFLASQSTSEVYKSKTSTSGKTISEVQWHYGYPGTATFRNFQIEEGTIATDYETYIPSVKMLAKENEQQSIEMLDAKMLGWSVPRDCPIQNTVSGNTFTQRVGRVDLGSLNWVLRSGNVFKVNNFENGAESPTENNIKANIYCSKYKTDYWYYGGEGVISRDNEIALNQNILYVHDSDFTDATSLKNELKGTYLYFKLSTPITMTIDGNEAVTKLKNDLSGLSFSVSGTTLSITDGTNTWSLSN